MKLLRVLISSMAIALGVGCDKAPAPETSTDQAATSVGDVKGRARSYEERQGMHVYMKYCAVCHGTEGKGDGFNSYNLDPKPRDFTDSTHMSALSDSRLFETISEGGRGVNKSPLMPSWGATLSQDDIRSVARYLRMFAEPTISEN